MGHDTKRVSPDSTSPRSRWSRSTSLSTGGIAFVIGVSALGAACAAEPVVAEDVPVNLPDVEAATETLSRADQQASSEERRAGDEPVGLSLWFEQGKVRLLSGAEKTVDLYGDVARYMQEIDITAQAVTTTDQGIGPIIRSGDMSRLDWRGIEQVDEDWRPEGNVPLTYTRSRFYRNARWMKRSSILTLIPVDERKRIVGIPLVEVTGKDDDLQGSDGGFVRRFDARQVTTGCRAVGDCSNATSFLAQGLMQLRDSLHPETRSRKIPNRATRLKLVWSEDPFTVREVKIRQRSFSETPYRYGFEPQLEAVNTPANGSFYVRGEGIDFRMTYRDGAGNRLHVPGSLPSYADFLADDIDSGIRYYDGFRQVLTVYYALKHREGNNIWAFTGPTDKLKVSHHEVPLSDFFALGFSQIPMATVAEDGYTSVFNLVPNPILEIDPSMQGTRPSDILHVTVPEEAQPGTYTMTLKGRRDWGGEALVQAVSISVPVGQAAPSVFVPKTGNCGSCHQGQSGFDKVLHRISDRKTCFGCHAPLGSEPDNRLDFRVHFIHSRSNRMEADPYVCSTCHLTPPNGPPVGFPGVDLVSAP